MSNHNAFEIPQIFGGVPAQMPDACGTGFGLQCQQCFYTPCVDNVGCTTGFGAIIGAIGIGITIGMAMVL